MAKIEPEYGLSIAVNAVRIAIANTPGWQAWTRAAAKPDDAARVAAAMKRVHLFALPGPESDGGYTPDELNRLRPACGLTLLPPMELRSALPAFELTRTAAETFIERGRVFVHVVETVDEAITHDDAAVLLGFCNRLGRLMYELPETHNVQDAAYITAVALAIEPGRATAVHQGTQGNFVQAMLRVDIGLRD